MGCRYNSAVGCHAGDPCHDFCDFPLLGIGSKASSGTAFGGGSTSEMTEAGAILPAAAVAGIRLSMP